MPTSQLSLNEFKEKIFDFEADQEWNYKGEQPAIIDFYADWCGPCRSVAPALEELSDEYEGKLNIYKVDTEKEQEMSAMFGIQSIPTFLFIPLNGAPMMQKGALTKNVFKQIIDEKLLAQNAE